MANDFLHYYIREADRVYKYRLKFACDELDEAKMDRLETALERYELQSCSAPIVTPIQENPLDFPNARNTRVSIVDCEVRYPASHDMLRNIAAESTGVNIGAVAVYGEFDPRHEQTARLLDDSKREAVLGTDYEQTEGAQEMYGKTLTDRLLAELTKYREERKINIVTNTLIPEQVIDTDGIGGTDPGETGGYSPMGGPRSGT